MYLLPNNGIAENATMGEFSGWCKKTHALACYFFGIPTIGERTAFVRVAAVSSTRHEMANCRQDLQ